jgi:FlaA1/EpsC-like NDP-sugar epimerase
MKDHFRAAYGANECVRIPDVPFHQLRAAAEVAPVASAQVVKDSDIVASLQEGVDQGGANEAGPASHESLQLRPTWNRHDTPTAAILSPGATPDGLRESRWSPNPLPTRANLGGVSTRNSNALKDARILVTGGTGSLGLNLIHRLAEAGARDIRIVARHAPTVPLQGSPSCQVRFLALDIARPGEFASTLLDGVDVVFHLAAMKDVSACEENPLEAVRTNVVGSANVVSAALAQPNVRLLLAASSDKACAPTSVLGMTKALMEKMVSRASHETSRSFGSVRLGTVWGTTGSVLTRWRATAARDGHFDVTDPAMTRFVLMPSEAVDVFLAVSSKPFAGQLVAPRMRSYQLGDLAEAFGAEHSVVARIVGRRRGEKLHEDLVSHEEAATTDQVGSMYIVGGERPSAPVTPFSSAQADRLSMSELRELVRAS